MKFFHRRMNYKRPLAAKVDFEMDGYAYKAGDIIVPGRHVYHALRRAYARRLIGHPVAGFRKSFEQVMQELQKIEPGNDPGNPALVKRAGPWYDVHVNGKAINSRPLRKTEAEKLL